MLHGSQFLIWDVCLCPRDSRHAGTTCLSYTLLGAMSLLQHHLFIWQSLLSVTGDMRSEAGAARALSLSLSLFAPADITDQQPFSTRQAEEAQICNISTWCNYSSFYLRELLRPLLNTTDIGECKITEEAAAVIWQWQNEAICLGEVWIQLGAEINSHVMR